MKNLITVSTLLLGSQATAFAQEQPNIVMLFVDDLGWADLGYNNPVFDTPNINKLKSDGLYFSRAYVASATSSPSRASLLTGKESLRCGFVRHIYGKDTSLEFETFDKDPGKMKSRAYLPLEEITYAERLKEFGYYNMFVGKWHLGTEPYSPTKQGFDAMYGTCEHGHPNSYYQPFFKTNNPFPKADKNAYLTNLIGDGAVDFINKYDKKTPFLLNVWYYGVHGPQIGRKDLVAKYEKKGLTGKYAQYAAMIEALDETVGEIRSSLKKKGIADNTVIIFSADQGGAFKNGHLRGGKIGGDALAEGGSRVPFIIYDPTHKKMMGKTITQPIETIDVYPTLVELASGKPCKDKQVVGKSLVPVLKGKKLKDRDLFMFRSYEDQSAAIINGEWKLIKYRSGKVQLYNISNDESETTNLINVYPERTKDMLERLNKWIEEATPKELL